MLGAVKLTVNISREQTCFAYISKKYCTNAQEAECVRVQVGQQLLYMWAVFQSGVNEDCILLDPLYCRVLGLSLFQDVYVSAANTIRAVDSLLIEADSFDDQVILEHNQVHLQTVFLNHVRVVVANQKAVVWLSPSIPIVFTPKQTGILVNHTKVIVKLIDEQSLKTKGNISSSLLNPREEEEKKNSINAAKGLLRPLFSLPKRMALRALPMEGDGKKVLIHPFVVFMHQDLVEPEYKESDFLVALIKGLPPMNPSNTEEGDYDFCWQHDVCVKVVPVNSIVYRSLSKEVYSEYIPTILIPRSLNDILDVYKGTMIMLTFIDSQTLRPPQNIEIVSYNRAKQHESPLTLIERFKSTVMEYFHCGEVFLINHDLVMQNSDLSTGYIKFRLSPEGLAYTKLTKEIFQSCTVSGRSLDMADMRIRNPVVSMTYDYKSYCRTIKPLELLIEKVKSHVYFDIHREARFNKYSDLKSSVLVTGLSGTGKSTLCNLIEKEISVFSYILRCRPLKGRKDIWSVFADAVLTCAYRKPALLILDDLDALLPFNMEGLSPQDIALYNRLATDIKQRLFLYPGVSLLITARVVADLHPTFRMLTGQPLFTAQFQMTELNQDDRVQLFKHLLSPYIRNTYAIDVDDVIRLAMDSSGYSFREIIDYFNKKLYAAVKKKNANPKGPKQRIVEDVTKDIDKAKAFDIWGPIGGMGPVKEKLNECIFWPVMYPALFPSQGCGILLYGPPGTGKSLIGSCLARLKGFNMITVKGPELLSKYIGQSEAAVREVFDKADMKRPCILFFDEFDSLAPKRGHDSTGVTDRVVNQLLARLDGAEGGARGPVLAATSRPDLIDPALLRTGRLATHIHCDLPTLDGRLEVLQTIAQDFHLRESVKLELVAEATEGYSPADLKSLLVTAQLSRLDMELLQISITDDNDEPTLETVVITKDDIEHALAETKPSLSKEQRQFYDAVYRRFRGEGYPHDALSKNALQISPTGVQPRMRVTLA